MIPISFLVMTVLYGVVTLLAIAPATQRHLLGSVGSLIGTSWVLAMFSMNAQVGRDGFRRADAVRLALKLSIFISDWPAIESGCKRVAKARLDQAGMTWTVEGARAVLKARAAYLSGQWDDFWQNRPFRPRAYGRQSALETRLAA